MISVVTPSYNMLSYLKCCHASVFDQSPEGVEHIVVDGFSHDGTVEWLKSREDITSIVEADKGMYDAVNKGLQCAHGDIVAYLNCDEQYLHGTLPCVQNYLNMHPEVDLVFGDMLVVNPDLSLAGFRKGIRPSWIYFVASSLYLYTCTMFLRRNIIDDGFLFNSDLKMAGDFDFVVRVLRAGYVARHLKRYQSAFALTGHNLSGGEKGLEEGLDHLRGYAYKLVRFARLPINIVRVAEKVFNGSYTQEWPLEYELYTSDDLTKRRSFSANSVTWRLKY
jgi:glycosyltransferase involved in cell wall biosynthesis